MRIKYVAVLLQRLEQVLLVGAQYVVVLLWSDD